MIVRDMRVEDKAQYLEMGKDFYSGDATLFPITEADLTLTFEQAVNKNPLMRGVILEEDGEMAGYGLLAFYWSCEAVGLVVQLEELYILERFRGKGLGHQYFEWAIQEYPEAKRFRLEVCHANPKAKALYEQLGFEVLDYIQMIKERK